MLASPRFKFYFCLFGYLFIYWNIVNKWYYVWKDTYQSLLQNKRNFVVYPSVIICETEWMWLSWGEGFDLLLGHNIQKKYKQLTNTLFFHITSRAVDIFLSNITSAPMKKKLDVEMPQRASSASMSHWKSFLKENMIDEMRWKPRCTSGCKHLTPLPLPWEWNMCIAGTGLVHSGSCVEEQRLFIIECSFEQWKVLAECIFYIHVIPSQGFW